MNKSKIKKIFYYAKRPQEVYMKICSKYKIPKSDEKYLKMRYKYRIGKELNLKNPICFNEKLQWLKLYDRNPKYTDLVDKYEVKKIVADIIGDKYIIPTIGIYNKFDEIDFAKLPNQFVIKCTHNSGIPIIVKNKSDFNVSKAKKNIQKCLRTNYFYTGREWPYKNVIPRIIIEEYVEDDLIDELRDYKFLCFNGEPKYVYITIKNDNIFENYYDMNFNSVDINHGFPKSDFNFEKPKNFNKMIEIAKRLSKDIPFSRIDLHNVNGKIYFGEITFYDWGGLRPYQNDEIDKKLGDLIKLPKK